MFRDYSVFHPDKGFLFLWERAVLATLADTKVIPPHPRKSVICGVLAQMRSAIYPKKLTADSECS